MNEIIERVARAICAQAAQDDGYTDVSASIEMGMWKNHIKQAIVAIGACRNPTDEMAFAGAKSLEMEMQSPSATLMALGYAAMIDAALNDDQKQAIGRVGS